ncbi:MAG TPA: OmpA family protein, partial [Casimicrobiaceae bacterium]|nr:OmpA family protein [Casimicrobiaceae bacterium]
MSLENFRLKRKTGWAVLAFLLIAACAAPPPPERPPAPASELTFDAAVDYAVDDLLVQARRLPAFAPKPLGGLVKSDETRAVIAVDAAIDGNTGQQTVASKALDARLLQRAGDKFAQFEVVAVTAANLAKAQFLLAGTLTPLDTSGANRGTFRISLSLTDIKTGFIVAQSVARSRAEGVDSTPTAFYRDSPSLTKDRVVEGQIRTAQTPAGGTADEVYLARLPVTALISEGSKLYEAGNYAEALRYYESAAGRSEGQQLRVFNGL